MPAPTVPPGVSIRHTASVPIAVASSDRSSSPSSIVPSGRTTARNNRNRSPSRASMLRVTKWSSTPPIANPATGSGSQNGGAGQASSSGKLELTTENFYSQVEEMIANGRAHDGQRVELTGFVLSPEAASAQASIPRVTDEESFAVARMAIWCCAADAYPVGFAVRWAGPAPEADSWVHVSGTLRVRGGKALVIEADSVTPAQTPNPEFVVQTR